MGGLDEFGIGEGNGQGDSLPTNEIGEIAPIRPGGKRLGYGPSLGPMESEDPIIGLSGEFSARRERLIRFLQGANPTAYVAELEKPLPDSRQVVHATILQDMSVAPFRKRGLAWYLQWSVGLLAGNLNAVQIVNGSLTHGDKQARIYVVDEIAVGGGSTDFLYGLSVCDPSNGNINYTSASNAPWEPEIIPGATAAAGVTTKAAFANAQRTQGLGIGGVTQTTGFVDTVDWSQIGRDAYGGSGAYTRIALTDVVLFPNEQFAIQQITVGLAFSARLKGRSFLLSQVANV